MSDIFKHKHRFVRVFMSSLTNLELWTCKCGVNVESKWDDKLGVRNDRRVLET